MTKQTTKDRAFVSMNWNKAFVSIVDSYAEKYELSRSRVLEAVIEGLSADQVEIAIKRGSKIIVEKRAMEKEHKKKLRDALAKLSPEQVQKLLKE